MLRSAKGLQGRPIGATDGDIGRIDTFLFDTLTWVIRYVVVDTGRWLPGRKVLILPRLLGTPRPEALSLPADLTREQVKNSPDIDADRPVSRQSEIALHEYYGATPYWTGGAFTAVAVGPAKGQREKAEAMAKAGRATDPHLRSTREVSGYEIQAEDGEIGHIADFIINEADWAVQYAVVDTRNCLPGRQVLISPKWIEQIRWADSEVSVAMTRDSIKNSPPYDPDAPVNRAYEVRLYDYYGRPKYWA